MLTDGFCSIIAVARNSPKFASFRGDLREAPFERIFGVSAHPRLKHVPGPVDQDRMGQSAEAISEAPRELAHLIAAYPQGIAHSHPLGEGLDSSRLLVGDANELHSLCSPPRLDATESRHFLAAGRAPRCPEIEDHHLALEPAKGLGPSLEVMERRRIERRGRGFHDRRIGRVSLGSHPQRRAGDQGEDAHGGEYPFVAHAARPGSVSSSTQRRYFASPVSMGHATISGSVYGCSLRIAASSSGYLSRVDLMSTGCSEACSSRPSQR